MEVRFKNSRNKVVYSNRFNRDEQTFEREIKEKYNKIQEYINNLANKKLNSAKIEIINSGFPEQTAWPTYEIRFKNGSAKIFSHIKGKGNQYEQTFGSQEDMDKNAEKNLMDIIALSNRYARKIFHGEIIYSRNTHEYNTNMYEEIEETIANKFNY